MYYGWGYGGDYGTWNTDYVSIPIDTPKDKIEEVAIKTAKSMNVDFEGKPDLVFVGVYHIMPLEDLDEYYGDE